MKLPAAANCFFVFLLFSAGPKAFEALAQEPAPSPTASTGKRPENQEEMQRNNFGIVIHGGAGTIERSTMTPEKEREYRAGLERALTAGYEILKRGGSSLDATEAAVRVLEDDPHFNAGKGSVFTSAGTNEMDAAIMDGKTLAAGAVACLKHIKNPIALARLVMERSGHVMMDGEGAEGFAGENGMELVDQKYFFTQKRWDALQKIKAAEKKRTGAAGKAFVITDQDREYFIRAGVAHEVSALIEYRGMKLQEAAQMALDAVEKLGGAGGLIAIDKNGEIALPFNTNGMYRGYVDPNGKFVVEIYK